MRKTLGERIADWAWEKNGSRFEWSFASNAQRPVIAQVRKHGSDEPWAAGYGHTHNEALNALADGLAEDGWPDDRDADPIPRAAA